MQSSVRAGQQKLEMTHRFWRMHFQESFTWGVILRPSTGVSQRAPTHSEPIAGWHSCTVSCANLSRFAYVSLSRASLDAEIYTDASADLGEKLAHDVHKTSAVEFSPAANQRISDISLAEGG